MRLIINNSSMQPIYEQIVTQLKSQIMDGSLKENEMLPSVRSLAKEIKVSALTVKKAYDALEEEGFVVTIHGKGSYVACASQELMLEEKKKGAAILLVSADLEELMSLSDRMLILCGGKCSGEVTDVAAATEEEIGLLMGGITHSREGGESA